MAATIQQGSCHAAAEGSSRGDGSPRSDDGLVVPFAKALRVVLVQPQPLRETAVGRSSTTGTRRSQPRVTRSANTSSAGRVTRGRAQRESSLVSKRGGAALGTHHHDCITRGIFASRCPAPCEPRTYAIRNPSVTYAPLQSYTSASPCPAAYVELYSYG